MLVLSVLVYQQERPIHVRDCRPKRRTVPGYRQGFVPIPRISASEALQRSAGPDEDYDNGAISFPSGPARHAAASRARTRRKLVTAPLEGSCCESAQQFRVTCSALAEPAQGFQSLRRSFRSAVNHCLGDPRQPVRCPSLRVISRRSLRRINCQAATSADARCPGNWCAATHLLDHPLLHYVKTPYWTAKQLKRPSPPVLRKSL
jgi:hypothetical protein